MSVTFLRAQDLYKTGIGFVRYEAGRCTPEEEASLTSRDLDTLRRQNVIRVDGEHAQLKVPPARTAAERGTVSTPEPAKEASPNDRGRDGRGRFKASRAEDRDESSREDGRLVLRDEPPRTEDSLDLQDTRRRPNQKRQNSIQSLHGEDEAVSVDPGMSEPIDLSVDPRRLPEGHPDRGPYSHLRKNPPPPAEIHIGHEDRDFNRTLHESGTATIAQR